VEFSYCGSGGLAQIDVDGRDKPGHDEKYISSAFAP